LVHQALVWLPEDFIQREAAYACVEVKQYLLLRSKRSLSKALSQALKLEPEKAAAGTPARP
jgi:hypothetical protein